MDFSLSSRSRRVVSIARCPANALVRIRALFIECGGSLGWVASRLARFAALFAFMTT